MTERNAFKDTLAWTIIYGGTTAVQAGIFAAAVAAGILTRGHASSLSRAVGRYSRSTKRHAWELYKETGSIGKVLDYLTGGTECG